MILQGYEHDESSCRKASCFALVALYMKIGDNLMPHLALLTGSKVSNLLFFALDSIFDPLTLDLSTQTPDLVKLVALTTECDRNRH